ncbi:hypothetical protein DBV15_02428 [Temnothorax longispinosus]|uniref:Uncharacterized protein n=1 Tax=Temnothorax longispinosus TaxID=300112 RepID=A0A4S2KWZ4_9HYME|nr:hypothetical protein DBV15_02428 [Temnothorax longispinosus]
MHYKIRSDKMILHEDEGFLYLKTLNDLDFRTIKPLLHIYRYSTHLQNIAINSTYAGFFLSFLFHNLILLDDGHGRILVLSANVRVKTVVRFNSMNHTLSLDKFELQIPGIHIFLIIYLCYLYKEIFYKLNYSTTHYIITVRLNGLGKHVYIVNVITPFFKNTIVNFVQEEATNAI